MAIVEIVDEHESSLMFWTREGRADRVESCIAAGVDVDEPKTLLSGELRKAAHVLK